MKPEEIQAISVAFKAALAPLLVELGEIRKQVTRPPSWTPSSKTVDVAAGVGKVNVANVTGKYFLCTSATAPFSIQFDDSEPFTCLGGLFVPLAPKGYQRITLINQTTDPLTVAFITSTTPFSFSGLIGG